MITEIRLCDLDEADYRAEAELTRFGLDGANLEIDLCPAHKRAFQAMSDHWAAAGRRAGHVLRAPKPRTNAERRQRALVRAWAREHGWPGLADRGAIPADARAAYDKARAAGQLADWEI